MHKSIYVHICVSIKNHKEIKFPEIQYKIMIDLK